MKRLLLLCLCCALPVQAKTLIEQAYEAGVLDIETALLYQVQAARDPDALPPAYQEEPAHPFCGTPLILQAVQARQQLSPEYGQRLAKLLVRRGTEREQLTPSGHFRIHYDLKGASAVDPADDDGNGTPDFVDDVARTLDQVWILEVDALGFDAPPTDGGLGGGLEYDVYIVELGRNGAYGYTYPEVGGNTSYSYLELDNNYTDSIYRQTRGLDALQVTVAHEFNHAIQFGYYQGNDGIWWQEATSTWMEDVAYPEVDDYLQYLSSFLQRPEKALDSGNRFSTDFHIYGASLFAHFLDQRYDRGLIRAIWEELGRRTSAGIDHFDYVIGQQVKGGLAEAIAEFAIWNYFTGPRHREGAYHEGDKYPAALLHPIYIDPSAPKIAVERTDQVDHLASTYLQLQPQLVSGGVHIDVSFLRDGRWRRQLILVSRDSVEIRTVGATPISIPSWDRYQDVVLVLTQTDLTGFSYEYSASVTYDPDLLDAPVPLALSLGQNFPNPFRPATHGQTLFPFSLDRASPATQLSIFATDGRLVQSFDLGQLSPRGYVQAWDGRNQNGEPVGSGIYYGVLETSAGKAVRTLAVVREE